MPLGPTGEPSPPLSPSPPSGQALRAFKGEGERRTEGHVGAQHPRGPLVQYWGEEGRKEIKGVSGQVLDSPRGIGMGGEKGVGCAIMSAEIDVNMPGGEIDDHGCKIRR